MNWLQYTTSRRPHQCLGSESALGLLPLHSSTLESSPDLTTLSEEEARLLLAALVQDYLQMKASELQREQETEDSR
uniref:Calcitonin n=1 Tax=Spermophilus dauricus TaxID=99837 RepID=A0A8C9Q2V3_SPEDA